MWTHADNKTTKKTIKSKHLTKDDVKIYQNDVQVGTLQVIYNPGKVNNVALDIYIIKYRSFFIMYIYIAISYTRDGSSRRREQRVAVKRRQPCQL